MATISVSDLKKKPIEDWVEAAGRDDLILTSNGRPVAILLGVEGASMEMTQTLLQRVRGLQAQRSLQEAARANGTSQLADREIEEEIAAARVARRKK